ncbi:MAG TPA: tetratricopeptide repeat protein [Trichormus sp.]|jgi:tetratricopeptide (TPR) repeat protein
MLKHKYQYKTAFGILAALPFFASATVWAAPSASFKQAVADYTAGKYNQAIGEFKQFTVQYPTNAQSHYYLALCYQAMGDRFEAKEEYTQVTRYTNGALATYAQRALQALGAPTSGNRTITAAATPPATTAASAQTTSAGAVAQVFDFYTDW